LIGYTHGGKEKPNDLFAIMAKEQALNWSETTFKE